MGFPGATLVGSLGLQLLPSGMALEISRRSTKELLQSWNFEVLSQGAYHPPR